jgi:hypothetical protein
MYTSPTLVVRKAFTAASRAECFAYQKPISRMEHIHELPTHIQSEQIIAEHQQVHANANRQIKAKKREYIGSTDGMWVNFASLLLKSAMWGSPPGHVPLLETR